MKYTEKYKVKWHDTDAGRIVRPSELLVYMQETANLQFQTSGRDLDRERDSVGVGFILSKISIDIHKPLHAYENIEVETWTCEGRGFAFHRCFRVLRDNEVIADAFSVWALVNIKDGKLIRESEYDIGFEHDSALVTAAPTRIKMPPAAEFSSVGRRTIVYSDIDYNMHMNNTRYPNMLCDFMEPQDTDRITGISLSYLHEAALGEELEVLRARVGGNYFFRTVGKDGKVCLEAQVICGE